MYEALYCSKHQLQVNDMVDVLDSNGIYREATVKIIDRQKSVINVVHTEGTPPLIFEKKIGKRRWYERGRCLNHILKSRY